MLTVAGTLLQNRIMLNFYRRIWRCVGLEMEGTYYLRQILKARSLGLMSRDVALRFLYYVSDVPLVPSATRDARGSGWRVSSIDGVVVADN